MPCLHVTSTALTAESVATTTSASSAVASLYAQCGGVSWTGATSCVSGAYCLKQNDYYYQCVAGTAASTSAASTSTAIPTSLTTTISHSSATSAVSSAKQTTLSTVKASSTTTAAATSVAQTTKVASTTKAAVSTSATTVAAAKSSTSKATTTAAAASTTTTKAASTTTAAASTSSGLTQWAGVNIAGFDFGCSTDGTCTVSGSYGPIPANGINGTAQMVHFYDDDKLNIFRLPVGWQYLTNDVVGGDLDATYFGDYDELMQGCLATGAYCVIDIHNYARWDGGIIGQGGPTNAEFAALWSALATKYKSESKVIFGVMNEPHDLTVSTWADTVQAAVTAIRDAGATSQYISLPGSDYASAASFISDGSAAALLSITNPDGTADKLIFDVHKYLDSDNSGTSTECVTNNTDAFSTLATWLRTNGRQAILSETGGGNTASCETYVCEELTYLNDNSDVYLGYIGWAAGSFASSYALTLTPDGDTDTALMTACFSRA